MSVTRDDTEPVDGDSAAERLAREIHRLRGEAGLSQSDLAHRIGYSPQYVSQAERPRKGLPSAALVRAIDNALGAGGGLITLGDRARAEQHARRQARSLPTPPVTGAAVDIDQQVPAWLRAMALESAAAAERAADLATEAAAAADRLRRAVTGNSVE